MLFSMLIFFLNLKNENYHDPPYTHLIISYCKKVELETVIGMISAKKVY